MLSILLGATIAVWFVLLSPFLLRNLGTVVAPLDAPARLPFLLVAVFSFMPLVFTVERPDGTAVLDQGLSASNMLAVALTGLTGLTLAYRVAVDRRLRFVPLAFPYLPVTLLLALDAASALWSIVPTYTLYRTLEVTVFSGATLLIFDRSDIERRLGPLLALTVSVWLVAALPEIAANLAHGIVFSSAKNNMMPLVCAGLLLLAAFEPSTPRRKTSLALGFVGFVIAGSAASTGALLASVVPAVLIASPRPGVRLAGWLAAVAAVGVFVLLMLGLSNFPVLLDAAAAILQKPAIELSNGTGRDTFWPVFIAATRDHVFGSGFSAADRFIQLLIPTEAIAAEIGQQNVHYASAHNMFLSTWAGTGVAGLGFFLVILGTAIRWGLKLDVRGRRFVVALTLMLVLNGMTTPGIAQDWSVNNLVFLAMLAYARVGAMRRAGLQVVEPGWPAAARRRRPFAGGTPQPAV